MAYTTGDLITKVQQRVRDTGYSSTEIMNYLNDAQRDIFNEYRLPFTQTTQNYTLTAGNSDITAGVGLPANYSQAINLTMTSAGYEKTLKYKDFVEIDNEYPDPTDTTAYPTSIPQYWYYYDETIRVFPTPSQDFTVTLRYYKSPNELDANADVPEVPEAFQEALVEGAAYRVLQVKDNYDQAAIHENKFAEIVQKLVVRYSVKQIGTPTRMRVNRYGLGKKYF